MSTRALIATLLESVVLPVGAFVLLRALGLPELEALVLSAGVSVVVVALRFRRTRILPTLGLLVLVRFVAGIVVALITRDAQLTLAKDPIFTALVALTAAATLRARLPMTARIRQDADPDIAGFRRVWDEHPGYRRLHRRLTLLWVVGLLVEAAIALVVVFAAPLPAAVVVTRVLTAATVIGLSIWTTRRDNAWAQPQKAPADGA